MREVTKQIEKSNDLDPLVYSNFYLFSAKFHSKKRNYEEFYKNGLQYLAYTHESVRYFFPLKLRFTNLFKKISQEQKISISVDMALAVLVSKKIYNFSELVYFYLLVILTLSFQLEQKVFKALENTDSQWIYQLIGTFNSGDIRRYEQEQKTFAKQIQNTVEYNLSHPLPP